MARATNEIQDVCSRKGYVGRQREFTESHIAKRSALCLWLLMHPLFMACGPSDSEVTSNANSVGRSAQTTVQLAPLEPSQTILLATVVVPEDPNARDRIRVAAIEDVNGVQESESTEAWFIVLRTDDPKVNQARISFSDARNTGMSRVLAQVAASPTSDVCFGLLRRAAGSRWVAMTISGDGRPLAVASGPMVNSALSMDSALSADARFICTGDGTWFARPCIIRFVGGQQEFDLVYSFNGAGTDSEARSRIHGTRGFPIPEHLVDSPSNRLAALDVPLSQWPEPVWLVRMHYFSML